MVSIGFIKVLCAGSLHLVRLGLIWGIGTLLVLSAPSITNAQTAATIAGSESPATAAHVQGFRSAEFGMDMEQVRAAIETDFGLSSDAITVGENSVERTAVLTIFSPDVLEDGGMAQVSYVFGYTTNTLIQVGVSWGVTSDPEITEAQIVANGDVLRNHFLNAGYVPESVETGTVLDNGILLFRGVDAEGRAAILLLQGAFADNEAGARVMTPSNLALIYSLNPDQPDIFRIKDGDF